MKPKFQKLYSNIAHEVAKMSYARRLQVGAVIVKDDRVISMGYNGMPATWENNCEDMIYNTRFEQKPDGTWMDPMTYQVIDINDHYPHEDQNGKRYYLKTKPEVLHAESNAIAKLARSSDSGLDADIFVTHAPCLDCAKLIYQAGIKRVFFGADYRDSSGVTFLKASGVEVVKYEE
jgi:dCMP deaminase